jgi:hypothetical protein
MLLEYVFNTQINQEKKICKTLETDDPTQKSPSKTAPVRPKIWNRTEAPSA